MDLPQDAQLTVGPYTLRGWRTQDAPALHAAVEASLASFSRWLAWCRHGYSLEAARQHIAACQTQWLQGSQYAFGVFDQQDRLQASIGLNQLKRHTAGYNHEYLNANLGYWVHRDAQGRGLLPPLVRAVARLGFERLGLVRIEIVAAYSNLPSRRVAERAGAQYEGIARHRLVIGGTAEDAAIYSLLAEDLREAP